LSLGDQELFKHFAYKSGARLCAVAAIVLALSPPIARAQPDSPCHSQLFENSAFVVCAVDTERENIRLRLRGPDGNLGGFAQLPESVGPDQRHVRFAMNAGMYDPGGEPSGLYVENGKVLNPLNTHDGEGNFYLKPNGVFWQDAQGGLHIEDSGQFDLHAAAPVWATQSGPLLLFHGSLHPQISPDGKSGFTRNGVGLIDPHRALFVIADDPISLGRLARFFRDVLHCRDALYFDGAISSAWIPATGRLDHDHPLGPMIVVLDKKN
jgi:uncharacterized protein YigE (DUF2233 family)